VRLRQVAFLIPALTALLFAFLRSEGSTRRTFARSAVTQGMSVSGNVLLKDGWPYRIHGFTMIGALTPRWCTNGAGITARSHYGKTEFEHAVNVWHANTIRLQVSQVGLADRSLTTMQRAEYLREIEHDVTTARRLGLVVILSMQDQGIGCGHVHELPTSMTVAAWRHLAPVFASSAYVMFELFNEPQNGTVVDSTECDWCQWRDGGTSPLCNAGATSRCTPAVGHQTLVDDIRAWGANNVLIADGARHAERYDNASHYLLQDSASGHGIGYAIHPYYFTPSSSLTTDESYWQRSYGFLVKSDHLVIATEWDYLAEQCGTDVPGLAPQFLSWLEREGIGMTAMALDYPPRTITDWKWDPTRCGATVGGNGAQTKSWFGDLSQAPSTPRGLFSSSTSSSITVSWMRPSARFALSGYDVCVNGVYRTTTSPSITVRRLKPGTSYTIGVRARDVMGNISSTRTIRAKTR
jgi:hypothetical protein